MSAAKSMPIAVFPVAARRPLGAITPTPPATASTWAANSSSTRGWRPSRPPVSARARGSLAGSTATCNGLEDRQACLTGTASPGPERAGRTPAIRRDTRVARRGRLDASHGVGYFEIGDDEYVPFGMAATTAWPVVLARCSVASGVVRFRSVGRRTMDGRRSARDCPAWCAGLPRRLARSRAGRCG
jgi:hypothetical protein